MRRFLMALSVLALLVVSVEVFPAVKSECCPTHFQVLKAYQESIQTLVQQVKKEDLQEFERRYHDKEALSYLDLLNSALEDIAAHYKELNDPEDEALVNQVLERIAKYTKELQAAKGAQAKKLVESFDVTL